MAKRIEEYQVRNTENLCLFIEQRLDIRGTQLQFSNGAFLTTLSDFIDDNPGILEVMLEWMKEWYPECDDEEGEDEEGEDEEGEDEEGEEE